MAGGEDSPPAMNDQQAVNRFQSEAVRGILLAMAGSVATSHFIGRTVELDRLRAAFDSTASAIRSRSAWAERPASARPGSSLGSLSTSARRAVWYWSAAALN